MGASGSASVKRNDAKSIPWVKKKCSALELTIQDGGGLERVICDKYNDYGKGGVTGC